MAASSATSPAPRPSSTSRGASSTASRCPRTRRSCCPALGRSGQGPRGIARVPRRTYDAYVGASQNDRWPLGEFDLIDRILARLGDAMARDILVPPGDDAAVWATTAGGAAGTIDVLAEGNHWRPDTMSMADVGWRAVAVNVSDLAAMGAEPQQLLVASVLGPDVTLDDLDGFVDGLAEACRAHGIRVAGGDIVRGNATSFTVAAYGRVDLDAGGEAVTMLRSTARPGDRVAVSGAPGASSAGLALIEAGRAGEPAAAPLLTAHRRPVGRVTVGRAALAAGVRCAIDVSDGLLQDLGHIAWRSEVGIEVAAAALPLHPAAVTLLGQPAALDLALGGGEDFELVLTGERETLRRVDGPELPVTLIGHVVEAHPGDVVVWSDDGEAYEPPSRGWDQLRPQRLPEAPPEPGRAPA
ncbi:MAG: thiamine-phosphate kinase [Dehalococcoidia bacterium]|nr:thiamine-phosphate kinase [Dehalococcoidia bacterium]